MAPSINKVSYAAKWGTRTSITFGGQPVPIGAAFGSNLAYIDFNDGVSFFAQGLQIPDGHTLQMSRLYYRAKGITLAADTEPIVIEIPFLYEEAVHTFSYIRSIVLGAGQQWLSFDGAITGINGNVQSFGQTQLIRNDIDTRAWSGTISFLATESYYRDIATTTVGPTALALGNNTFNITYSGQSYAEPYYTIEMPNNSSAPITFTLNNSTAGQALTFILPANGLTYVVDTTLQQIYQQGNTTNQIQHTGSFPYLYPPTGTVNVFRVTLTGGTAVTPTITTTYQNRYSL